ncbi:MAG TPA: TIGR03435 family protein [Bryobacteraceae bacterium]|jgi:uncharacterized protein (TIGR03435 family)
MRAVLLTLLAAGSLLAQTAPTTCATVSPAAAKSEFDAASVKPAGPFDPATAFGHGPVGGIGGGPGTKDPGRAVGARFSLANLIMTAFDLSNDQVTGPDWMKDMMNNGFTLTATIPAGATREEYCGMLRSTLTSRFHLTFHIEKQSRAGYELTLLPGGPKFKKYDPDATAPEPVLGRRVDANGFSILPPSQPRGASVSMNPTGRTRETLRDDMASFARGLGNSINQSNGLGNNAPLPRVIDKTGLEGVYEIRLDFAGTPMNVGQPRDPNAPAPDPSDAPNIFNAVEKQLGLKLTKVKDVPVDVLIVDHADQTPTEN